MKNKELFNSILNTFENDDIKEFALNAINHFDDYIWDVPASSTGKYHPSYSLGDGGLIRHTISVVKFLNHMFGVESIANQFTSREKDLLRVAAITHDCKKSGSQQDYNKSKYTKFNHPLLAADFIRKLDNDNIGSEEKEFIAHVIESHMGSWNTDKRYPDVVLPTPQDKYQIILHLADYLASRKDIEMKFDDDVSEPKSAPDPSTYVMPFGKHKGKTITQIKEEDPGYVHWAKSNMSKEPMKSLFNMFD